MGLHEDCRSWRLVDSGIVTPEFSAAADEAILNARIRERVPDTLHFYIREHPTISIGHNASIMDSIEVDEVRRRGVKVIRRFSGGSAVYTDSGQLIFAIIVSSSLLPSDIMKSYEKICTAVIAGLSELGITAKYTPINDICVGTLKISGSAQLRRGGAVLHHGTIIVDSDIDCLMAVLRHTKRAQGDLPAFKQVTSLRDLMGCAPEMRAIKRAIAKGLAQAFDVILWPGSLIPEERADIARLIAQKYGSHDWNWQK